MLQKIRHFISQFRLGMSYISKAIPFIFRHQLWRGILKYNWLVKVFLLIGIIFGMKIFTLLLDFLFSIEVGNPIAVTSSALHLFQEVGIEGYNLFYLGGFKYVVVLAMEVLIIHFGGKTTEILTGKPFHLTFKQFIGDQFRALKMILRKYVLELIVTILLGIVLGIIGMDFLESPFVLLIQCYFLGVVILDNYFKQRGKSTGESEKIIRRYAGLATAIGMFFYIMLIVPLIGAVIGACVAGVAGTLALNELKPLEADAIRELISAEVLK